MYQLTPLIPIQQSKHVSHGHQWFPELLIDNNGTWPGARFKINSDYRVKPFRDDIEMTPGVGCLLTCDIDSNRCLDKKPWNLHTFLYAAAPPPRHTPLPHHSTKPSCQDLLSLKIYFRCRDSSVILALRGVVTLILSFTDDASFFTACRMC